MTTKLHEILSALDLADLLPVFLHEGIDDSILADLSDDDLSRIGVEKLGHRRKLLKAFAGVASVPSPASPTSVASPGEAEFVPLFSNSLGLPFVAIPRFPATLFCVWPTRICDYERACLELGKPFPEQGHPAEPDHPVVNVSWHDAIDFCVWLTAKERDEGRIADDQLYRLPTDLEWSAAVGLPHEPEASPEERSQKIRAFPWGLVWPPPRGAGNYSPDLEVDDFLFTSPVGHFAANQFGIHDLGGNVWEWCMDEYAPGGDRRVLRGASWYGGTRSSLLSSYRHNRFPGYRDVDRGLRIVRAGLAHLPPALEEIPSSPPILRAECGPRAHGNNF